MQKRMKSVANQAGRTGLILSCLLGVYLTAQATDHMQDSLGKVKEQLKEKRAVLVDVREPDEWNEGVVADAILISLSELKEGIDSKELAKRLPPGKIVYTYCRSGVRSRTAADIIVKSGYDVRPLKAGYRDLIANGFPRGPAPQKQGDK